MAEKKTIQKNVQCKSLFAQLHLAFSQYWFGLRFLRTRYVDNPANILLTQTYHNAFEYFTLSTTQECHFEDFASIYLWEKKNIRQLVPSSQKISSADV